MVVGGGGLMALPLINSAETSWAQDVPFNILIPHPFELAGQDPQDLNRLRDEVMDKVHVWETQMNRFFLEYNEAANSWRMIPRTSLTQKPRGLFNSKSGETNRAVNTLATLWFRMLTAADPFYEARKMGLNEFGLEMTEDDLFAVEGILGRQLLEAQFKRKFLKALRSLALFGTVIVEAPFVSKKNIEYTDFVFRSMLQTGFDPYVFDLDNSDYIFTIDYPTKYALRQLYFRSPEVWDKGSIERAISSMEISMGNTKFTTDSYSRITQRKQRAGYSQVDNNVFETVNYHGKLDTSNRALQNYWESEGRQDDILDNDFTIGILSAEEVIRLHATPFGTWHHLFKTAHNNEFELEPVGYGVGKIGKKAQRELDVTTSRMNNALMMALYGMWKVSKYAGLKSSQLNIKPFNLIELEDINQLEQLKMDLNMIAQALAMQGVLKEDFRTTVGAHTNLQAQITKATATEASLTQTEAIRGNSVIAELIAETLVRDFLMTSHINNTELLDTEIFTEVIGMQPIQMEAYRRVQATKMRGYNRFNLLKNVGFVIKVVSDKDFRPDRIQKLLEVLNLATSIRNVLPEVMNVVRPTFSELFRALGMDPRELNKPIPIADQMSLRLKTMMQQGRGGGATVGPPGGGPANQEDGEMGEGGTGNI